ncbi:nuclear transport factor 2 family protein [Rufibacter radiotolerans]|nr:nuclear transport factor 2 family protein [Rufibacter radiotolerans]
MKNFFLSMIVVMALAATGCNKQTTEQAPVDATTSEASVTELMDKFHASLVSKNASAMTSLLAEDGLFAGTDPKELFDKKQYVEQINQMFVDSTINLKDHKIEIRKIVIDRDGTSATVVEQFKMNVYTPNIPWRLVSHLTKVGDSWKINVLSFNMTPSNEQTEAIVKAVK